MKLFDQTRTVLVVLMLSNAASAQIKWRSGVDELARKSPAQVANDLNRISATSNNHFMLQLDQPLTDETRQKLAANGVNVLSYLGNNAFFASVDKTRLNAQQISGVKGLSRLGEIPAQRKMHEDFVAGTIRSWTIIPQNLAKEQTEAMGEEFKHDDQHGGNPIIAVYAKFHGDVVLNPDATRLAKSHGALVISELFTINALVLELPYENIKDLAAEDRVEWVEPALPKMTENNAENRARTGADIVQAAPYNLNGAGVTALVYDGGRVLTTHVDFQGRAIIGNGELACTAVSSHSTHVAGTIAGAGVAVFNNRGMAPGANIVSYGLNQNGGCSLSQGFLYTDPGDMQSDYNTAINTHGADIANNSIGTNTAPNGFPCTWEGDYGVTDVLIDSIVRGSLGAPFRVVWANGNERQVSTCNDTTPGVPAGYHKTAPPACAKNHITVGALNSNDDSMTSFSSWGPADDGRMKPDISAPGCQVGGDGGVTSCTSTSNTAYAVLCGTSMASPTVCGCSALLLQDYRAQYPGNPDFRNSTLKILLAHTAVDLGNVGPDYQFGYGSIRIQSAIDFMRSGNFLENSVSGTGATFLAVAVVSPSDTQLKVTLAWDDPPGTPNVSPALVNDLDLRVFDASNNQYYPWTLGGLANVTAPAVRTVRNSLDNIEQVLINNPTPGAYRIEVHGFNVPQGPQPFSLCASPLLVNCSSQGTIGLDRTKYPCSSTATLRVSDCDLNTDDGTIQTVNVTISSTSEPGGETVTLTESAPETATFLGNINLSTTDAPGVLHVSAGDTITATYIDANDGNGHLNVVVTDTAVVDCTPPAITNVQTSAIGPRTGTVTFTTDEIANGVVHYGTSCGSLTSTATELGSGTSHSFVLSNLTIGTQYFFSVGATDEAGNSASDDNHGSCYTFTTTLVPDFYTEIFEASDNDTDNRTLLFTPNGSISYYAACGQSIVNLPTDPTGGTPITTWTGSADDGNSQITLSGGQTVKLYGTSYGSVFVGTNGYVTFGSGDTDYTEALADHFAFPRIAALFNDLDPGQGGTVSWKQLSDKLVVTWLGVFHHSVASSPNTFQIEMYFDGRIQISWLAITDTDGLAGLSQGLGLSPDFSETDLSSFSACGPLPPFASNSTVTTPTSTAVDITPVASDPNNDPLSYIILSLPSHGSLSDPGSGPIASVPYTLVGGGSVVHYAPTTGYVGFDSFTFKVNDGTFDSNVATVTAIVGTPQTAYSFPMDSDPGWTTMGQWAFGHPTGGGSHNFDPANGFTGTNVYGYNLAGDYPNNLTPVQYLTTPALNCNGFLQTKLRFRRWLGIESSSFDHATVDVSNNGTTWTNVFNHNGAALAETAWSLQTLDISAVADGQSTVYIRWGMGTTDGSVTYPGWNIDDVEIVALVPNNCLGILAGDLNFDTKIDGGDIARFTAVVLNPGAASAQERCAADLDASNSVDINDIDDMATLLLSQ